MTLWFKNSYGEARQIAYCKNTNDVYRSINDFIEQANDAKPVDMPRFKSYYIRSWNEDGKTWYDVGSHTEFFYTTEE